MVPEPAGAPDPRLDRRARGRDEDGPAAPPAGGVRHAARGRPATSTCATCRWYRAIIDAFDTLLSATTPTSCAWSARRRWAASSSRSCSTRSRCARRCCSFSGNILLLSLLISGITATLVYVALHYMFVRPLRRITANMMAFRDATRRTPRASSRPPGGATRSASPSASSPPCRATSPRCCSRRAISPRSGSRSPRSTTTCATCWPRRSCSPTGSRPSPIRTCSASRPS